METKIKNYLTDIIINLRFSKIEINLFQEKIEKFIDTIQKEYPTNISLIDKKLQIKSTEKSDTISGKLSPSILFRKNDEKQITFKPDEIIIEYNGHYYKSFDKTVIPDLELICNSLNMYNIQSIVHFSMRYINQIPYNTNILNQNYENIFDDENSVRSMTRIEYAQGNYHILFNYGEYNANYPSTNIRNNFILDYETFNDTPQNFNQLKKIFSEIHTLNKKYFYKTTCETFQKEVGAKK